MADFCYQCTERVYGADVAPRNDFADANRPELRLVLCEGCGWTGVDPTGRCQHLVDHVRDGAQWDVRDHGRVAVNHLGEPIAREDMVAPTGSLAELVAAANQWDVRGREIRRYREALLELAHGPAMPYQDMRDMAIAVLQATP